ncbi:MAG: alpha-L-fucosidase, partial [Clostridia bacterium]|nr:alpha-L-fucosidase [Clostridia bacterium]
RGLYNYDSDLGSLPMILHSEGLVFSPAETDMSIRPGWFWHEKEEPHSLDRLFDTYIRTVGGNTTFNLNVPPNRDGLFDERDVKRLKELGQKIRDSFADDLSADARITVIDRDTTHPAFVLHLPEKRKIKYVELAEQIENGQRVELFAIYDGDENTRVASYTGTTIGNKKIVPLQMETDTVTVQIRAARGNIHDISVALY